MALRNLWIFCVRPNLTQLQRLMSLGNCAKEEHVCFILFVLSTLNHRYLPLFKKIGPFPASFSLFSSFLDSNDRKIQSNYYNADVGNRTANIWCRKRPLCQLRHNHGPTITYHLNERDAAHDYLKHWITAKKAALCDPVPHTTDRKMLQWANFIFRAWISGSGVILILQRHGKTRTV